VTPFSWGYPLAVPVYGARFVVNRISSEASVAWYRYWHYQFLRKALARQLATCPDAVIYAHCPVSARAALESRRHSRQRVVMAVHFTTSQADEWVDNGWIRRGGPVYNRIRRLERDVIPAVDGIVYVARSAQTALTAWLPSVSSVPSRVIPNFVPAPPPTPLALRASGPDLVSVGGLETVKNHRYLLRVLQEANRLGHRYRLDIIGDGPCRRQLRRMLADLGLEGQVRLVGHRSDVRELLPRYRAYVHSSLRETMALAPIEAMAAGLPLVVAPVGGLEELLDPGVEGFFWSLDDPTAGARVLVDLLEDEESRARMAGAARDRFARQFSSQVVGPKLLEFLA
jgi:glycosyltransferase involved in cell wall biosynthesis